jgi:DNA-binding response OmpR family regulator
LSQTIFVLEDDSDIARLMQHHLEASGFAVRLFSTTGPVVAEAERAHPALFMLDIMVPGGDGLELCRRLRKHAALSSVPIIFVTAKTSENDRVLGLELGADDYITMQFGDVEIDGSAMQLRVRGELTATTATEFRLLDYLARHPGRVFTRDHLLDAVWGDSRFVTPRSVDVYVRRIREKIETDPEDPHFLKTVRGAGYRFEVPKQLPREDWI